MVSLAPNMTSDPPLFPAARKIVTPARDWFLERYPKGDFRFDLFQEEHATGWVVHVQFAPENFKPYKSVTLPINIQDLSETARVLKTLVQLTQ